MTHERLHQLLENPALLAGMPYEELKTLALSYPYAHNLRYLLALKSNHEQRPDAQRTLTAASVYSLNRSRLYALIAPQKIVQHEEVLELKPIESLQKTLETRVPITRQVTEARQFLSNEPLVLPETPVVEPVQEAVVEINPEKPWVQIPPVTTKPSFGVWISQFNPVQISAVSGQQAAGSDQQAAGSGQRAAVSGQQSAGGDQQAAGSGQQAAVRDQKAAGSGQQSVGGTSEAPNVVENTPLHRPTPPEVVEEEPEALGEDPMRKEDLEAKKANDAAHAAQRLAERSVQENKEIASETLARLYWRQGHKEKALAMYERLCLLFPEKSDYFASEIDKLKK
ncbi:MAG: hypothetical protein IT270_18780 [Saprospiraceae bacterium]|nr:hypothetical protein [Saprospiraceae bacterium]